MSQTPSLNNSPSPSSLDSWNSSGSSGHNFEPSLREQLLQSGKTFAQDYGQLEMPSSYQIKFLEKEMNKMQEYISELERSNLVLSERNDTLQSAYRDLLERILPNSTSNTGVKKSPSQADYPKVKYWTKWEWTQFNRDQPSETNVDTSEQSHNMDTSEQLHGKSRSSMNVNVAMQYICDLEGNVIDGNHAGLMHRHARCIWLTMSKEGTPPPTWGAADVKTCSVYLEEMYKQFPELSLCNLDWKADQIATNNYPSWYANHSKKKVKMETRY